jgi:hypothetical protein
MSGNNLWNPAKKLDKDEVTQDTTDRSDMSGLVAGYVQVRSLEPGKEAI